MQVAHPENSDECSLKGQQWLAVMKKLSYDVDKVEVKNSQVIKHNINMEVVVFKSDQVKSKSSNRVSLLLYSYYTVTIQLTILWVLLSQKWKMQVQSSQ